MNFNRGATTPNRALMLLAPEDASLQQFTGRVTFSRTLHSDLTAAMQRLRGTAYSADGAIRNSDLISGRHISPLDRQSWHLLSVDDNGEVLGCTRFRRHENTISASELTVSRAPIAECPVWGQRFQASIDSELNSARKAGFVYVEVGGWALAPDVRCTTEALRSVLATYAWAQLQGGAVGVSTATTRHHSSGILRRLGGEPLTWGGDSIPPYYDESYGCSMEILRFDSRRPNQRYIPVIRELRAQMAKMQVISPGAEPSRWSRFSQNLFGAPVAQPDMAAIPAMA